MKTSVFHSVNAGLYFYFQNTGIWIDGIHDGSGVGMSLMPDELIKDMECGTGLFQCVSGFVFTHLHEDHFNKEKTERFLQRASCETAVYTPTAYSEAVKPEPLAEGVKRLSVGSGEVLTKKTMHDGEGYQKAPHESVLLRLGGESFYIAGDAVLDVKDAKILGAYGEHMKMAFLNLYQLGDSCAEEFLQKLGARCVMLYHLPFPEDDRFSYRIMARQIMKKRCESLEKLGICVKVPKHMTWIK
ncbi:Uncharacterised protein [uncultured Roseburia sp.]|uniref:Metallo-beta-lactamase domain-containing protein n=1 Tax=Brotonthovivens ammoniilytica TaxID=2981725 RepID=A0ABT2TJN5_9FIRM|nr:hypothetical protein [Brotonthovivens ammoniilytica]MCU6762425.1 hypothetical protein [Brotonthovivens ammoniilytica]SCI71273.1 Uncharacterised protein [uncultured Roseburia sp.]